MRATCARIAGRRARLRLTTRSTAHSRATSRRSLLRRARHTRLATCARAQAARGVTRQARARHSTSQRCLRSHTKARASARGRHRRWPSAALRRDSATVRGRKRGAAPHGAFTVLSCGNDDLQCDCIERRFSGGILRTCLTFSPHRAGPLAGWPRATCVRANCPSLYALITLPLSPLYNVLTPVPFLLAAVLTAPPTPPH